MGVIYIATSPSGKSYVGKTKYTLETRWRDHIYDAFDQSKDHCKLLNRAIRKYGPTSFKLDIIETCSNDELDEKETYYIAKHNTIKPHGYNLTLGGGSGAHLPETKAKISEKLTGIPKRYDSLLKRSATKKGDCNLPMYLIEHKKKGVVVGYRVTVPNSQERKFANTKLSLDENLQRAYSYWQSVNDSMASVQRLNGDGSER